MADMKNSYGFSTRSIHAGQTPDPGTGAIMTPIYASSTFVQSAPGVNKGYEYSRLANPTRTALESCLANLEGGARGYAFASGLAANNTVLELLEKDSHVIAIDNLYGGSYRLFERVKSSSSGLEVSYVPFSNPEADIASVLRPNTRMVWIESPTNPLMKVVDLKLIAEAAAKHGLISVCDNTFATPYVQRPLELGFDIVVHSATKYLNGHSDLIAGAAVIREQGELAKRLKFLQNALGGVLSTFDSFLVLRGLKTLAVRMKAHVENAKAIAEYLEAHPKVELVLYPGLPSHPQYELAKRQMSSPGGMLSFLLKGDETEAKDFVTRTKLFALAESLGGVESLIEHPYSMTHLSIPKDIREAAGIKANLIRLSPGIEDASDLIADLEAALY